MIKSRKCLKDVMRLFVLKLKISFYIPYEPVKGSLKTLSSGGIKVNTINRMAINERIVIGNTGVVQRTFLVAKSFVSKK